MSEVNDDNLASVVINLEENGRHGDLFLPNFEVKHYY